MSKPKTFKKRHNFSTGNFRALDIFFLKSVPTPCVRHPRPQSSSLILSAAAAESVPLHQTVKGKAAVGEFVILGIRKGAKKKG
jgi:hypothetical protein